MNYERYQKLLSPFPAKSGLPRSAFFFKVFRV